jgi:hypothetical protein
MFTSIQTSRSLRPVLIGSLIVLSLACRNKDDRSNAVDTTNTPPETATSAPSARTPSTPTPSAPTAGALPDKRPGSTDPKADERMPVAGRDDFRNDAIELGGGGAGGAGGSHHK